MVKTLFIFIFQVVFIFFHSRKYYLCISLIGRHLEKKPYFVNYSLQDNFLSDFEGPRTNFLDNFLSYSKKEKRTLFKKNKNIPIFTIN